MVTIVLLLGAVGLDKTEYLELWTFYVSWSVHNAAHSMAICSYERDWYG
jgi:hypothetical protein